MAHYRPFALISNHHSNLAGRVALFSSQPLIRSEQRGLHVANVSELSQNVPRTIHQSPPSLETIYLISRQYRNNSHESLNITVASRRENKARPGPTRVSRVFDPKTVSMQALVGAIDWLASIPSRAQALGPDVLCLCDRRAFIP